MKDEKLVNLIFYEEQSSKVIYLFFIFFNKRRILRLLNEKIKTFFTRWKEYFYFIK
jgi:hypothetical protein